MSRLYLTTVCLILGIGFLFVLNNFLVGSELQRFNSELKAINVTKNLKNILSDEDSIKNLLEDKLVVINVWSSWCGPCIKEIPELNKLTKYSKSNGIVFLAVNNHFERTEEEFLSKKNIEFNYTRIYNKSLFDYIQTLIAYKDRNTIPQHLIIDRTGKIKEVLIGASSRNIEIIKGYVEIQ